MAQWFEGLDGQVVLDDDHVWILREGIPEDLTSAGCSVPVRASRGAVIGTDFRPATATEPGMLRVRVRGEESPARVEVSDPVRFSLLSNDRFSTLGLLLGVSSDDAIESVTEADQLRAALDGFEGIATQAELTEILGAEPDAMKPADGVTWKSVGSLWVAAGGTVDTPPDSRLQRIRELQDLTRQMSANAGIKTLQSAVAQTSLQALGTQRLGGLWEAVMSEAAPARTVVASVPPRPRPQRPQRNRTNAEPAGRQTRPRTRVWTKWDGGSPAHPDAATGMQSPTATRDSEAPDVSRRDRIAAPSGRRIRIHLDCDGHRVKAVFDLQTRETEITLAQVGALVGSTHPDPTAAAKAVITAFRLGDEGPFDGWSLWKVDDSSGRSLSEVPEADRRLIR